jgi:hypothetical protein
MSAHFYLPKYLIQFQSRSPLRWNGRDALILGHPAQYIIEKRGDSIWVRNLTTPTGAVQNLVVLPLRELVDGKTLSLDPYKPSDTLSLKEIQEISPVSWTEVGKIIPAALSQNIAIATEDAAFIGNMKKGAIALFTLLLVVMGSKMMEPDLKTNEDLIPKKFAKIIMTKPKELSKPAASGAAQSRAQAKAVARAFQTKTVQNSLRTILKGGLSRYSIMSTGKSIQSLSQKINANESISGVGLEKKANALIAGVDTGKYRMGTDAGYGTSAGVNVKGQGHGQLEIGLNTQDASVDEGLTKEEVARVIHSHMNEIRYCYEAAILKDATIAGKLLVDFKINGGGNVPNAGISEASMQNQQVSQCLLTKLRSWKFPQPRGGVLVAVSYPFIFKSLSR